MHRMRLSSTVDRLATCDQEVMGSSLTHFAAEYGPGQAADTNLPLSPSSIFRY